MSWWGQWVEAAGDAKVIKANESNKAKANVANETDTADKADAY